MRSLANPLNQQGWQQRRKVLQIALYIPLLILFVIGLLVDNQMLRGVFAVVILIELFTIPILLKSMDKREAAKLAKEDTTPQN